jgi:K+-transporting ATPase ATPase A chain
MTLLDQVAYKRRRSRPRPAVLDAAGKPVTEAQVATTQTIAMGPVASQEAIKMLGTNGGGFFNANSAHPYENPTVLSNFPDAGHLPDPGRPVLHFGRMVGDSQGWAVLAAMTLLFVMRRA